MTDRWKQGLGITPGAHQQSARPSTALRERQVQIRFVNLAEIQAAHVSDDADHLTTGNERVAFAGKGHRAFFRSDFDAFSDRVIVWPEAPGGRFAYDDYRRLFLRLARRKESPANDWNAERLEVIRRHIAISGCWRSASARISGRLAMRWIMSRFSCSKRA